MRHNYFIYCLSTLFIYSTSSYNYEIPTKWESSCYIWNFDLIAKADKGIASSPKVHFSGDPIFDLAAYKNINIGDIIWLECRFLSRFCNQVLPNIDKPIILLIAGGDESFPSECGNDQVIEQLINNQYIVHIFAQNNDYNGSSSKISSIPIGIDYHTVAYKSKNGGWGQIGTPKQQEEQLAQLFTTLKPTYQRKPRIFADFQLSDTMHGGLKRYLLCGEDRKSIFDKINATGLLDTDKWMPRPFLWAKKGEYAFSVSPHGNGLDCHRTWEDLVLGCIVIVKSSVLDVLYEGLPVVIIKDWSEITEANLHKWLIQYGDAFTNQIYREKLTNQYWWSKIKSLSESLKEIH